MYVVMEKEETYGLELNTLLSVCQLQGKEGPIVTHVVNFMPPIKPINTVAKKKEEGTKEGRKKRKQQKKPKSEQHWSHSLQCLQTGWYIGLALLN